MKNVQGFTLAEIIVVIALMAIIGTMMVVTFSNALRGSNKSQILAVIKQNGQAALENMDKTIRGAEYLICPNTTAPGLTLVVEKKEANNDEYIRYRFVPPTTSLNGHIIWDHPVKEDTEDIGTFLSDVCTGLMSGSTQILTDTDPETGVNVYDGSFTANKKDGYKDSVIINFRLRPGINAPQAISGQINDVTFQTTVQLR